MFGRFFLLTTSLFLAALPESANAQGACGTQCVQVVNRLGQMLYQCAPRGCGIGAVMYLNRQPVRYPPSASWQPYRPPPGYYRPQPTYPGRWYPSRRYY